MTWSRHPVIYEVNTAVWLEALSREAGELRTLSDVTASEWDTVTPDGTDAVWLMGVWERSPAGLAVAKANDELMASFRQALPDLEDADVIGSPYCVRRYVADAAFGGPDGLAHARAALAARDKRLVLDYVPNHVAPDHPWVTQHPDRFVRGSTEDLAADPSGWMAVGGAVIAHGKDPYFPPWPDVLQLDAFSAETRTATVSTLAEIAAQCDGIRCDMAMLMTNNVFAKTWGTWTGPEPADEFWPFVIGALRAHHPEVRLLAEAYWDLEWELQQQGFDFCYDKRLYDRFVADDVDGLRDHVRADLAYQSRLVRFLENHDEPRIAALVTAPRERAGAVVTATLPGATLWHEGQFEGRRVRPPVFLRRRPDEPLDADLAAWYRSLVATVARTGMRSGTWELLDITGWPDNPTHRSLVGWSWRGDPPGSDGHVVVVNLSDQAAQGLVQLRWPELAGRSVHMLDHLSGTHYQRPGDGILVDGLYVDLDPWQCHLMTVT